MNTKSKEKKSKKRVKRIERKFFNANFIVKLTHNITPHFPPPTYTGWLGGKAKFFQCFFFCFTKTLLLLLAWLLLRVHPFLCALFCLLFCA